MPGMGGTYHLPKLIGLPSSLDMILTGKRVDANKAKKLGFVDEVVEEYELEGTAINIARQLSVGKKFKKSNVAMLIFNKKLSVSPVTTHLPLKNVSKTINKKLISEKVLLIDKFYKTYFGYQPKIAITGLNPHCESINKFNEDEKILKPAIKSLIKRRFQVSGPFPADTIFLKKNRERFDVILGMYHDQVLTPIKTLFEYDAINITLGLPFLRVSPDHGPNEQMLGKNRSNPLSLLRAISFLERVK